MIVETDAGVAVEALAYDDVPEDVRRLMERGQDTVFAVRRDDHQRLSAIKAQLRQSVERDLGPAFKAMSEFIDFGFPRLKVSDREHEIQIGVSGCCDLVCRYQWQETDGAVGRGVWRRCNVETGGIGGAIHISVYAVAEDGKDRIYADSIEEALFLAREAFIRSQMAKSVAERQQMEDRIELTTPSDALLHAMDRYILSLIRPRQAV